MSTDGNGLPDTPEARNAPGGAPAAQSPAQQRRAARALLWRAARPDAGVLRWALPALVAAALLEAVGPMLGKAFIDRHLVPHVAEAWAIGGLLGGAWLAGVAASLLRYLQLRRLSAVAMRSVQRIRETVYGHVLRLPMAFFDRALIGQLVSRVTNDTEAVKTLYVQVLFVLLDSVVTLVGMGAAMLWLDVQLSAVVALLVPAVMGIVWLYQRWSAPAVTRARALRSDINAMTAESIAGMATLQAAGAEYAFNARYASITEAHFAARREELRANAWLLRPALDMLNIGLVAAVIGVFGLRQAGGALGAAEVGLLYAFVSYIARVVEPMIQITMQFSQLQQAVVAASRVNALLDEALAPRGRAAGTIREGRITVRDLHFGYTPDRPVLHGIELDIAPGRFVGLVGHTGSGKTTLLSLLLRYYESPPGSVSIDGHPLAAIDDDDYRQAVGLVLQDPFVLAASARENITMGRAIGQAAVEQAARDAGIHDAIVGLPQGYDTPLGEGGARLSVGQKQLVALARALAGTPRILLLDEATSHIDSETEAQVQRSLAALRGRVTVLAVAHRLSTIRDADEIIVLHHGRIVERGAHARLMAIENGRYQRLVRLQQLEGEDLQ